MKIEHIAIWVKDLEKMKKFYETYFGAKSNPKYVNDGVDFSSYFLMFHSGARLEIMRMPSIPESQNDPYRQFSGFIHIAISVGSRKKVDELTEQLAHDGYTILDDPKDTGDGYYESTVLDPEQNRIEITV